jgi:hypothetical protein
MLGVLGVVIAVYALLCAWVYARQRSMIYYPMPERASAVGEAISLPVEGTGHNDIQLWARYYRDIAGLLR